MAAPLHVATVDYHTAGEPFRIVTAPVPEGRNVVERRRWAAAHLDHVRRLLVHEPRGHADMYGGFVTPPDDDGGDLGVVFFHNAGYSTACGHGTIALVTWALEHGRLPATPPSTRVVVDTPSGRLAALATLDGDGVTQVAFHNVPAYVEARGVAACGHRVDIAFGGAFYAVLPAPRPLADVAGLIGVGRRIKEDLNAGPPVRHPTAEHLQGVYGVIFVEDMAATADRLVQRNLTVFADGQVDRSPTGSGTSARLALLHADGALGGRVLENRSVLDTVFTGRVVDETAVGDRAAVVTEVAGSAHLTGYHHFVRRAGDPLPDGFLLR